MELVQFISAYREINSIYEKFVDEKHYSFKNQQKLTDFYKTILDLAKIEKSISKEVEYQLVGDEYYYPSELFRDIKEYRKQQIKKILNEINKN